MALLQQPVTLLRLKRVRTTPHHDLTASTISHTPCLLYKRKTPLLKRHLLPSAFASSPANLVLQHTFMGMTTLLVCHNHSASLCFMWHWAGGKCHTRTTAGWRHWFGRSISRKALYAHHPYGWQANGEQNPLAPPPLLHAAPAYPRSATTTPLALARQATRRGPPPQTATGAGRSTGYIGSRL